ncbi:MAG TPA: peptide-methionine (S)-S-oxide reductase MsrA [Candidatus Acidoferrum sp.]|nr:peptide-methionine (S)-S-oxide reductase MsrA [Candidatus Acidoferrum sp.]
MPTPHIGRTIAIGIIVLLVGWTALRSLGARPPAMPNGPMPRPAVDAPVASAKAKQTAVLAGGCFWGVQAVFKHTKGVLSSTAGYAGGFVKDPSYEAVSTGMTGHAESVQVVYDPSQITYGQLLMIYFSVVHDPTQLDRQGPDTGSQYRSSIFYTSEEQKRIAEAYVAQLTAAKVYARPIVTKIIPLDKFYTAEEYHQDYAEHHPDNPYIQVCDIPKLDALKREYPELYRPN